MGYIHVHALHFWLGRVETVVVCVLCWPPLRRTLVHRRYSTDYFLAYPYFFFFVIGYDRLGSVSLRRINELSSGADSRRTQATLGK